MRISFGSGWLCLALQMALGAVLTVMPGKAFADPRVGAVFSSSQTSSQSFVRIYNGGTAAATATVQLADFGTGEVLGQWVSPPIPGGAEQQFDIKTMESGIAGTKPYYYSMNLQAGFTGYFQHVLWKPSDGTLTNLSTCAAGVTAAPTTLVGVHSSLLNYAFPSAVVVNNTGAAATNVILGVYDARDNTKLGTYTTAPIPAGGAQILSVTAIESAMGRTPSGSMYHYVIKTESLPFTGFLQHLVNNLQAGVTTDMTTECAINGAVVNPPASPVRIGAVFSTAQSNSQSFIRFYNISGSAGTATVTLRDQSTGQSLGTWNSPIISPGAEVQYDIGTLESAFNSVTKPSYYTISVQASFTGYVQHVLWRVSDGTLTNLSTCGNGVTADKASLTGVHSSLLGGRYPSGIVINNTGAASELVTLGVYDARDGSRLGGYTTPLIPNNAQFMLSAASLEVAIGKSPTPGMYHYVIKAEGSFTGFLQNLVNNLQAAVITDMTTACILG